MAHYLVTVARGPAWDPTRPRRAQRGWEEHAGFMDALTERGTVLLGGPVGDDVDRGEAVLLICADGEAAARKMLSVDPWHDSILTISSVKPWSLWLRSPTLPTLIG